MRGISLISIKTMEYLISYKAIKRRNIYIIIMI